MGNYNYYLDSSGKVQKSISDSIKGFSTVAPEYENEFSKWLTDRYGKTYDPTVGLKMTGSPVVDETRMNNFAEYLKGQEGGTGAATNADGTPAYYNGNNYDDDPEKVATTIGGNVLENAFAAAGQKDSVSDVGMGFGEYLKTYGVDTDKAYSKAVRGATNDFYRALMTYGQRAETMAGAGLTSSGLSDYGNAAAYAARQGAVADAGEAKLNIDAQQAASFAQYLEGKKAEQKQRANERVNLLTGLLTSGLDVDTAMKVADQSGLIETDEQREAFISAIKGQNDANKEATNNAEVATVYELINSKMSVEGANLEGVKAELKALGLYSENVIDQAVNSFVKGKQAGNVNNIGTVLNNSGYNPLIDGAYISHDALEDLKAANEIDEETYKVKLDEAQKKNGEFLLNAIGMAHKSDSAGNDFNQVCEWLGTEASAENAVSGLRERAQEMYNAGDISKETYIDYLKQDSLYEVDDKLDDKGTKDKGTAVASVLTTFWNETNGLEDGEDLFEAVLDNVIENKNMSIKHNVSDKKTKGGPNTEQTYFTHWVDIYLGDKKIYTYRFDTDSYSDYSNQDKYDAIVTKIPLQNTEFSLGITKEPDEKLDSTVRIFDSKKKLYKYTLVNGTKGMNKNNQSAMAELIRRYIYRKDEIEKK